MDPQLDSNYTPPLSQNRLKPRLKMSKKKVVIGGLILLFIALISGGVFYYTKKVRPSNQNSINSANLTDGITSDNTSQNDVDSVVNKVKKLMLLPDETPILATVTDLEKVKGQVFFTKAQLGDKVLIYMQAKKAILYRPTDNIIIEVGRVNDQLPQGQVAGDKTSTDKTTPIPETTGFLPPTSPSPTTTPLPTTTSPTPTQSPDFSSEY